MKREIENKMTKLGYPGILFYLIFVLIMVLLAIWKGCEHTIINGEYIF
jgi:hypothetical protein